MPVAEENTDASYDERASYEFAFHVLPTVAEGEVGSVVESIKKHITKAGGECGAEEMPERVDLEYPIIKQIEGKNRKFTSAYFGWIRFSILPEKLEALTEELTQEGSILRSLMLRLTRREEENPFRFHEHRKSSKHARENDDHDTMEVSETEETEKETEDVQDEGADVSGESASEEVK